MAWICGYCGGNITDTVTNSVLISDQDFCSETCLKDAEKEIKEKIKKKEK